MLAIKKLLFLFACLTFAALEAAGDCLGTEFKCTSGQCIDQGAECDGKIDCRDESDESQELCQAIQCPQYAFQCAYGACIEQTLACNNVSDCRDGSDENEFRCLKTNDEIENFYTKLQGGCEPHSMECTDRENGDVKCIGIEKVCDGVYDCGDKSDESVKLCFGLNCPDFAFRCSYGACISPNLACNHIADCVDNSDEDPKNCIQKEKDWQSLKAKLECYSGDKCILNEWNAVMAVPKDDKPDEERKPSAFPEKNENAADDKNKWLVVPLGENPKEFKSCMLPKSSEQLQALNYITGAPYPIGASVPSKTLVTFRCPYQQAITGKEYNACYNGKWQVELPQCEHLCPARVASRGISTLHSCIYRNEHVDCTRPARPGTVVQYMCAPNYQSSTPDCLNPITCNASGKWSAKAPTCTPICGEAGDSTPDQRPWVVTIYQSNTFGRYNLKCYGAVVSPKLVISVGSCFDKSDPTAAVDPLLYNIAEGKQLTGFHEYEGHGLRLHNLSHVILESRKEDILSRTVELALLKIVDYFHFSMNLSPICIHGSNKDVLIVQADLDAKLGEIIELTETDEDTGSPRTYLSKIVYKPYPEAGNVDALDVGQFRVKIISQIKNNLFIL